MSDIVLFINTRRTALELLQPFYAARKLGLDVILMSDKEVVLPEGLAREVLVVDTFDSEAAMHSALSAARRHHVVGVLTWSDRDVELVAKIAMKLGLPGFSPTAARSARNKYVSRCCLNSVAPDLVPRYYRLFSEADLLKAADSVGFPAILKPVGASGSKGIFEVKSVADLRYAFEQLLSSTVPEVDPIYHSYPQEMILEERIDGTEHSVEAIIVGGKSQFFSVTDKSTHEPYFIEKMQIHPSSLPVTVLEQVGRVLESVIVGLELDTGAVHVEFKAVNDGSLKIIEVNARSGGDYIASHLVKMSTGFDFLCGVIAAATGLAIPPIAEMCPSLYAGSAKLLTPWSGRFHELQGVAAALSVPGIDSFTLEAKLGSVVRQPPKDFSSFVLASFIGRACSAEALESALVEALNSCNPRVS